MGDFWGGGDLLKLKMPQKYDLHTHFFTNWDKGKYSLERHERSLKYILNAMKKEGLDGIVLANGGSEGGWKDAYEQLTLQIKDKERLGEYTLVKKIDNALEFADDKKLYKIIKGQEVLTKQGHIIAIGLNYGKIIPSRLELETALKEIKSLGGVSDAAHAPVFLGIGIKNLKKYKELIDVWEAKNMNYENSLLRFKLGVNPSIEEADEIAKQLEINWIAVSDCHNKKDLGNGQIEIENLDFSSANNLRASLRYFLVSGKFTSIIKRANSLTSVLGHMIIYSYDIHIRNKVRLVTLESC